MIFPCGGNVTSFASPLGAIKIILRSSNPNSGLVILIAPAGFYCLCVPAGLPLHWPLHHPPVRNSPRCGPGSAAPVRGEVRLQLEPDPATIPRFKFGQIGFRSPVDPIRSTKRLRGCYWIRFELKACLCPRRSVGAAASNSKQFWTVIFFDA